NMAVLITLFAGCCTAFSINCGSKGLFMLLRNSGIALAAVLSLMGSQPGAAEEAACAYEGQRGDCAIPLQLPSNQQDVCVPGKVTLPPGASAFNYSVEAKVGERLGYSLRPESGGIWRSSAGGCGGFVMSTGNFHDWRGHGQGGLLSGAEG